MYFSRVREIYILDIENDNQVKRVNTVNRNKSYKGLVFDKMKDAHNYREYILNQELEEMGIIIYDTYARLYNEYSIYVNDLIKKIKMCSDLLAARDERYKNGFFSTAEWKERDRLEREIQYYRAIYGAYFMEALEKSHIQTSRKFPNEKNGSSFMWTSMMLYQDKYLPYLDTPENREYINKWRIEAKELANKINQIFFSYKTLDERTKTGKPYIDNLKYQAIRLYVDLQEAVTTKNQLYIRNIINVQGQNKYVLKQVKDLKKEEVLRKNYNDYNIYFYNDKSTNVYKLGIIYPINNRMALITEYKRLLLKNNDWVVIDKEFNGEKLDYSKVNNLNKPFYNNEEQIGYTVKTKDFDGSDRMKKFFGLEDKNKSID